MGIILGKRKQQTVRTSNTLPTSTPPPDPGSRDSGSPARQEKRSMPDGKETDEQATPVDTDTNESESSKDELSDDGTSREGEPLRLQESSTMSDIDEEKNEAEGSPSEHSHNDSSKSEEEERKTEAVNGDQQMCSSSETIKKAVEGDLDMKIPERVKIVRIFTSSTFTDTSVERNTLMERVYPKLKSYCQERGYDFQVVDMRWGVRDEATDDHMTSELCMRELRACQKLSTGPNFITFLGQKYGYRPFPPKISATEFEKLLSAVKKDNDHQLLTRWFRRDDNLVPAHYLLQPITSVLPHYRNYENLKLRKKASGEWWAAFERMQVVLREAADHVLSKDDRQKFYMSVTEDEIRRGIISVSSPTETHCCWFKRVIVDLHEHVESPNASKFVDKTWGPNAGIDEAAQALLGSLRETELPQALPSNMVFHYDVKWTENGIDPESSVEHAQYIDNLCACFYDTLTGMIENGISISVESKVRDHLVDEVFQHAAFCQKKCETFHGREEFMKDVREALLRNNKKRLVVLHGESGCGKTSLMAKLATQVKTWVDGGTANVVLRFVGTSPDASHVRSLLRSVCMQLYRAVDEDIKDVPEDTKSLITFFPKCLETVAAASSRPVIVILDSLDQLSAEDGGRQLDWLPTKLPDNVYVILSTLPGQSYGVFPKLKGILPGSCLKKVPPIPLSDAGIILDSWLKGAKRSLTAEQKQTVLDAFQKCPLPLYLKLAFDEACRWKSYTPSTGTALAPTVRDIINALFERVERVHGKILVTHALGYVTASKNGLTEPELEDLLSLDDEVLNDVYQYWTPPVRRLPPLLWIRIRAEIGDYLTDRGADEVRVMSWYHRQFVEVARERYLPAEQATKIHKNMSEYFLGKWSDGVKKPYVNKEGKEVFMDRLVTKQPLMFDANDDKPIFNHRKLSELPYHLLKSRQIEYLKNEALCNFEFVLAKLRATSLEAVLDDLAAATDAFPVDQDLPELEKVLQLSAVALRTDSRQLGTQLLSRLLSHLTKDEEHTAIKTMLQQVYASSVPCLIPSRTCLTAPGGALVSSIAVSDAGLHCGAFSCDNKTGYVGTTTLSGLEIDVVNIRNGKHLRKLTLNEPREMASTWAMHASELNNGRLLLTGSQKIFLLDTDTGQVVQDFEALKKESRYPPMPPVTFSDSESRLVAITDDGLKIWTVADGKLVYSIDVGKVNKDGQYGTVDALGHLAVYSIGGNKSFKVLDVKTGLQMREVEVHKGNDSSFVQELKIAAGDKVVVLSSNLNALRLYNINTGGFIREISEFSINKGLHRLQLTSDRKTVLSVANFEVMITDLETGYVRKTLKSKSFGTFVVHTGLYCRDGRYAFSFGHDNILRIYDLKEALAEEQEESQGTKAVASTETINNMHSGPDGRHVICTAATKTALELSVWDTSLATKVRSLRIVGRIPPTTLRMCSPTRAVGYIHDTNFLHFKVYDLKSGKVERCLHGKASKRTETFGFINEKHMVSFSQGRRNLKVWDIDTGKVVQRHIFGQQYPLEDMLISKDGTVVVCAQVSHMVEHKEKTLPLVVLITGSQEHRQLEMTGRQLLLTWSSLSDDGRYLLNLTSDYKPVLWDLRSGNVKHQFKVRDDPATYATAISSTLNLALTAHSDGNIKAWEIDSGRVLYTFKCDTVDLILVSADGHVAYSRYRYRNSNIDAWNLRNGAKLATFTSDWKPEKVAMAGNHVVFAQAESPDLVTLRLHVPGCTEVAVTEKSPYEGVATEGELTPCPDSPVADEGDKDPDDKEGETDAQKMERTTKAKYARPNVIIGSNVVMSKKVFKDNFEKHL